MWRNLLRFVTGPRRKSSALIAMKTDLITKEDAQRAFMPYAGEDIVAVYIARNG